VLAIGTRRRNFKPSTPTMSATMHSIDGQTDRRQTTLWCH